VITIHLALLLALLTATGGGHADMVVCLGGGHEHAPGQEAHCESACDHGASWPLPVPAHDDSDDCRCTDVELGTIDFYVSQRLAIEAKPFAAGFTLPARIVVAELVSASAYAHGPPPWFDPHQSQRAAIVASVRLII
jgi:hypothetical protein